MKRFRALLKVSLQSMLLTGGRGKKKKRAVSGWGVMVLLAFIALYISGVYSSMLLEVLAPLGMEELVFIYMGIGALLAGLLYTVFAVKGIVFGGRDNDLLLSMPVPSTLLMVSRVAAIYLEGLVLSFFILVPAGVVCAFMTGQGVGHNVGFWVRVLLCSFLLPLLDTALSVLIGALLAFLSSKTTKSTWGQNLFMGVFLVVVFWFSFNLNGILQNLAANAQNMKAGLTWAMPLVWMAEGIMGNWGSLLTFALCCVIPFALVVLVLGKVYRRAVTAFQSRAARSDYKLERQSVAGQTGALLRKEARRFFGTPVYFWNGGLGPILLLVMAVAALVKSDLLREMAFTMPALPIAGAAIGFCLSTCVIAAPSVSLEGRCLWILREAPVSEGRLVWVKTGFQMLITIPCGLIAALCLSVALALPPVQGGALVLMTLLFAVGQACFAMLMGLTFPKLDAANETVVIKQSMASLLSIFVPVLALAPAGVLYAFVGMWAALALLLALTVLCAVLLARMGPAMLAKL